MSKISCPAMSLYFRTLMDLTKTGKYQYVDGYAEVDAIGVISTTGMDICA